jgi:hypothetical protein
VSRQAARDAFWVDEAVDALVEGAVMSAESQSPHQSPLRTHLARYGDQKVANREIRVRHGATEKGP